MSYVHFTYSGRYFNVLEPKVSDVSFLDIAHHLSAIQRFAGATTRPISVARHSLNVAQILSDVGMSRETILYGLLHDAHEFVSGDIPSPFKEALAHICGTNAVAILEARLDEVIFSAANLAPEMSEATRLHVKWADKQALLFEKETCLTPTIHDWTGVIQEHKSRLEASFSADVDKVDFLSRLSALMGGAQ